MYDEAGITSGGSSGGGVTSADLGGGPSFGGDSGYDNSYVYQPTVAQLNDLGPGQPGDSGITTILNKIKGYVGSSPTVSRGIGTLFGNILGNILMPGIGGLIGGYLGNRQGANYSNQYNLNREAMTDFLGGRINTSPIYTPPGGINTINTPNFTNPNIITDPNLNNSFYLNNLYATNTKAPTSGYDLRQEEKDKALEQFYQENPELRPQENSLLYNGVTSIV